MRVGKLEYWFNRRDKTAKLIRRDYLFWSDPLHYGRKPKSDKYKDSRKGK